MARHKIKPNLDIKKEIESYIDEISEYYGEPYDDRNNYYDPNHISLRDVAKKYNISVVKAKKILITAGKYSTSISRKIQSLYDLGISIEDICNYMDMSKSSINSYIPYNKTIYDLDNPTTNSDRQRRFRERKRIAKLKESIDNNIKSDYIKKIHEKFSDYFSNTKDIEIINDIIIESYNYGYLQCLDDNFKKNKRGE